MDVSFSIAAVWECIRPRSIQVDWFHVVWFSYQILRHAIHLWLVIKQKLKTQDLLRQWDVSNSNVNVLICPLCEAEPDSHNHLFFRCPFASRVWEHMKNFMCIPNIPVDLNAIVDLLIPLAKSRSIRSVICKLVFAAPCYFIWQERNHRLFTNTKRSQDQIIEMIKSNVRLKLLTCSFKKKMNVMLLLHLWKLPESLIRSPL
ncbi:zinc knuckle CX2CX4HX4C containing protein [Tanacetum coccineum]